MFLIQIWVIRASQFGIFCLLIPLQLSETAFVATPHGKNSLKLMSPKVTSELRTRLARQAKDQMNLRIANGKKTLNDSIRLVDDSKTDVNTKHRTKTNLVEIYNHFRKKAEVMHKEKEGSLKDDFDL